MKFRFSFLFQNFLILFLFCILFLPVLYLSYKYHNPFLAFTDYFSYYPIYKDLNFKSVESPFNMRLLSSFVTHFLYKLGIYYHTEISFEYPGYDQRVFFSAVFTNWISLLFSAWMIMLHLDKKENLRWSHALLISILFLFSFGNLLYCMNGNTDGFSVFLVVILYLLYERNNYFILFLYLLTVFQREVALLFFLFLSGYDYIINEKRRFYLISGLFAFFGIMVYYTLRKTYFYTPYFSHQIDLISGIKSLINNKINLKEMLLQVFLPQTFYYPTIFLLFYSYKKFNDKRYINDLKFIFLILVVFFVFGMMTLMNNNLGRFYHMISPVVLLRFFVPGFKELVAKKNFL